MVDIKSEPIQLIDPSPEAIQRAIVAALQDPGIPKAYMNGFNFGHSGTDMFLALNQSGKIFEVVYMSFNTAKTLAIALQDTIAKFEQATGQPLFTMFEVQQKTQKTSTEPVK